jgi:hypothetical protein
VPLQNFSATAGVRDRMLATAELPSTCWPRRVKVVRLPAAFGRASITSGVARAPARSEWSHVDASNGRSVPRKLKYYTHLKILMVGAARGNKSREFRIFNQLQRRACGISGSQQHFSECTYELVQDDVEVRL